MAWTMAAVRAGLATRLATITTPSPLLVYSQWPDMPVVPSALIGLQGENPVDYDDSMEGAATLRLTVDVLVQKVVTKIASDAVDAYIDPTGAKSIRTALNSGALTNAWEFVTVVGAGKFGQYEFGTGETAARYLGVEFNLEIGVN